MEISREKLEKFISVSRGYDDGYGNGSGSGNGNGSGNGSGSGYGSGSGDGYGYGYGDGSGSGCGNGYGRGNGDGSGSGYGNGSGSGNGYGTGIKEINGMQVVSIDYTLTVITSIHQFNDSMIAKGYIIEHNVFLLPCYVIKRGDVFAHGKTLKEASRAIEEKIYERMDKGAVIEEFKRKFPELDKQYPVSDFYIWHNRLTGSCEMGRKAFAENHGIDIERDKMTVREFCALTKDSFGGDVIRELSEALGIGDG